MKKLLKRLRKALPMVIAFTKNPLVLMLIKEIFFED